MRRLALLGILGICLATPLPAADPSYDTVGPGVWLLRLTNPPGSGHALCVRVYFNPNHDPWHGSVWHVGKAGKVDGARPPDRAQWLAPGESTGWLDIGPDMCRRPTFGGSPLYLSPVFLGAHTDPDRPDRLRLTAELATGTPPRIVRRLTVDEPNPPLIGYSTWLGAGPKLPTLGLLIPVDPQKSTRIWTLEEAAEQQLRWAQARGPLPARPRQMIFWSHFSGITYQHPSRLSRLNTQIAQALGYNNLVSYAADAEDLAAMRAQGIEPQRAYGVHGAPGPDAVQSLRDKGLWPYIRQSNFGDEIDIKLSMPEDEQDRRFRAELQGRDFDPLDFVRPADEAAAKAVPADRQWQYVRLQGPLPVEKPQLLYEAAVFRYRLWTEELAAQTKAVAETCPPGTWTGANFSPHMSNWPDVRKWINPFRDGGMTMPWSEDWWWQLPEAGPQPIGFLLDALRLAASYHDLPIQFYCISDVGETPEHFVRMNFLAAAHGAKVLNHFAVYNQAFGTCDYVDFSASERMYPAIHRVIGDLAQVDERLFTARLRRAPAAILLSKANDVWDNEDLLSAEDQRKTNSLYYANYNADNHERKALWLALRHAQLPVDLITDDDLIDGRLAPYRVLYLVGAEIQAAAVPPLTRWVEKGGILFACGGAGLLDEYRRPLPAMRSLLGIESADLARPTRHLQPRQLPDLAPLGTVNVSLPGLPSVTFPALAYRQVFTPADAQVIGRYADGTAAALHRQVGRGQVITIGSMPGLAYLRPAMSDPGDLPTHYPADLRAFLAAPYTLAGVGPYVQTTEPLVEATLMTGPKGSLVPLINFTPTPLRQLRVTFPGLARFTTCRSLRHGPLKLHGNGKDRYVELPLDLADILVVD